MTIDDLEKTARKKEEDRLEEAVRLVQTAWMSVIMLRRARYQRERRRAAARRLQKWYRAIIWFFRPLEEKCKKRLADKMAATRIQAVARGWQVRRDIRFRQDMRKLKLGLTNMQLELNVIPIPQLTRLQAIARTGLVQRRVLPMIDEMRQLKAATAAAAAAEKEESESESDYTMDEELERDIKESDKMQTPSYMMPLGFAGMKRRTLASPFKPTLDCDASSSNSTRVPTRASMYSPQFLGLSGLHKLISSHLGSSSDAWTPAESSRSPSLPQTPTPPTGAKPPRTGQRSSSSCSATRPKAASQPTRPHSSCAGQSEFRRRRYSQPYSPTMPWRTTTHRQWTPLQTATRSTTPDGTPRYMKLF